MPIHMLILVVQSEPTCILLMIGSANFQCQAKLQATSNQDSSERIERKGHKADQGHATPPCQDVGHFQEVRVPGVAHDLARGLLLRRQDVVGNHEHEVQHRFSLCRDVGCKVLGGCTSCQPFLHSTNPTLRSDAVDKAVTAASPSWAHAIDNVKTWSGRILKQLTFASVTLV